MRRAIQEHYRDVISVIERLFEGGGCDVMDGAKLQRAEPAKRTP